MLLLFLRSDAPRGRNSITLYYQGVGGPSAEVFHFNTDGKVSRAFAHYA